MWEALCALSGDQIIWLWVPLDNSEPLYVTILPRDQSPIPNSHTPYTPPPVIPSVEFPESYSRCIH